MRLGFVSGLIESVSHAVTARLYHRTQSCCEMESYALVELEFKDARAA
jgi:hypothetical protein